MRESNIKVKGYKEIRSLVCFRVNFSLNTSLVLVAQLIERSMILLVK